MSADEHAQDITFRPAWRLDDATVVRDAKEFWCKLKKFGPQEAERRVSELCAAAYEGDTMAAVATAFLADSDILKTRLAFFRCAVAPGHRRHHVSYRLAAYSRKLLEKWAMNHPEENIMGMAAVIQAGEYKEKQREPTWPEYGLNLNLVGYNPLGDQIRVAWFSHVKLA